MIECTRKIKYVLINTTPFSKIDARVSNSFKIDY